MTLPEGLSHYRWIIEQSHKYWAYFQVAALGSAGFVWSTKLPRDPLVFGGLVALVAIFSYASNRAIVGAQKDAIVALDAIQKALPKARNAPGDLNAMIRDITHTSVWTMRCWNIAMIVVALAVIGYRYFTLPCPGVESSGQADAVANTPPGFCKSTSVEAPSNPIGK